MRRNYMGHITNRDIEMVELLISAPLMPLEKVGAKLGVSKQAVAERKKKLERLDLTRSFYFWNVTPRFESTKWIHMTIEDPALCNEVLNILDEFKPVSVSFLADPEKFFSDEGATLMATTRGITGILLLDDKNEEQRLRDKLAELGIQDVSIKPVLIARLLGERGNLKPVNSTRIEELARQVTEEVAAEPSVEAVLYDEPDHPVDQFDLIIIRDKRFQSVFDSYERRLGTVLLDYHFMNMDAFLAVEDRGWLKKMKLLYTRDNNIRTRVQRKLERLDQ